MSDIQKFIKHFKASAAYHRKKAEQAEAEVARLSKLEAAEQGAQGWICECDKYNIRPFYEAACSRCKARRVWQPVSCQ